MERERFIELITDEQEHLRRFLLALCVGNRDEAEEIAQTAMIKAYICFDRFHGHCKFSTWLFKIAYNTFLDSKKDIRRKHCPPNENIGAEEEADSTFRYQELYNALEKLPEKERVTVLLYYINGYSIKEIAEISGSTEGAIKVRLSRGRDELREILKNE